MRKKRKKKKISRDSAQKRGRIRVPESNYLSAVCVVSALEELELCWWSGIHYITSEELTAVCVCARALTFHRLVFLLLFCSLSLTSHVCPRIGTTGSSAADRLIQRENVLIGWWMAWQSETTTAKSNKRERENEMIVSGNQTRRRLSHSLLRPIRNILCLYIIRTGNHRSSWHTTLCQDRCQNFNKMLSLTWSDPWSDRLPCCKRTVLDGGDKIPGTSTTVATPTSHLSLEHLIVCAISSLAPNKDK